MSEADGLNNDAEDKPVDENYDPNSRKRETEQKEHKSLDNDAFPMGSDVSTPAKKGRLDDSNARLIQEIECEEPSVDIKVYVMDSKEIQGQSRKLSITKLTVCDGEEVFHVVGFNRDAVTVKNLASENMHKTILLYGVNCQEIKRPEYNNGSVGKELIYDSCSKYFQYPAHEQFDTDHIMHAAKKATLRCYMRVRDEGDKLDEITTILDLTPDDELRNVRGVLTSVSLDEYVDKDGEKQPILSAILEDEKDTSICIKIKFWKKLATLFSETLREHEGFVMTVYNVSCSQYKGENSTTFFYKSKYNFSAARIKNDMMKSFLKKPTSLQEIVDVDSVSTNIRVHIRVKILQELRKTAENKFVTSIKDDHHKAILYLSTGYMKSVMEKLQPEMEFTLHKVHIDKTGRILQLSVMENGDIEVHHERTIEMAKMKDCSYPTKKEIDKEIEAIQTDVDSIQQS